MQPLITQQGINARSSALRRMPVRPGHIIRHYRAELAAMQACDHEPAVVLVQSSPLSKIF